jgi:hypothetical protein
VVVTSIIWGAVPGNQFANRWVIPKSSGNGKRLPERDRVGVTCGLPAGFPSGSQSGSQSSRFVNYWNLTSTLSASPCNSGVCEPLDC